MKKTITGTDFTQMIFCASQSLNDNCQQLNDLNVFPVPDGDTGTNMSLTMSAADKALRSRAPGNLTEAADATASALLRGARGNSGVIMSLLFRGMSKGLKGRSECSARDWARAMEEGVEAAYKAVMKPAEGTVLTVSRLAAEKAMELTKAGLEDVEEILAGALDAAREALENTTELNPVLKKAGVVDAGGAGYVRILEAMLGSLNGTFTVSEKAASAVRADTTGTFGSIRDEDITFTYCTEFIVAREHERSPELLRSFLSGLGDCLVLVEDEDIIKVHVHTDAPGRALTEALQYGALQTVKIENMRNQHTSLIEKETAPVPPEIAPAEKAVGFVSVCAGEGMADLFRELGVDRIVTGGQTMNPSTEDILREVNLTPAETVFVLPNNKNIIMAAQQCAPLTEKRVVVIPTKTVPQGVSALTCMDPEQSVEELTLTLTENAGRVRTALVTYAARDSDFDGHAIRAGEYLGLLDGKLLGSCTDLGALLEKIAGALKESEPAFLSVFYGADVTSADAEAVGEELRKACADAEVSVVCGGQPVYYYMISAE